MPHKRSSRLLSFVFVALTTSGIILQCLPTMGEDTTSSSKEHPDGQPPTTVKTTKGSVKGLVVNSMSGKPVRVFYGIPYAEPPVGKLRFSRSKPNSAWSGTFDATIMPNSCVQLINNAYGDFSGVTKWNANTNMSEDCLKLNVWTPIPPFKEALAVLVWIYGGGFSTGTSTLDMYDARTLVSKNGVIVVSMNYRVASLGFLSFGTELLPGNAGLYDQHLALEWVRDNIAAFGGDPKRVTLFGQSTGAASVAFQLLSPLSSGLFDKVILESGSALSPWGIKNNSTARTLATRLAGALGCSQTINQETLDCLREKDPLEIVKRETGCGGVLPIRFVPVVDGLFLPKTPQAMIAENVFPRNIRVLVGSNLNEGTYYVQTFFKFPFTNRYPYMSRANFTTALRSLDPSKGLPPVDEVLKMYTGGVVPSTSEERVKALALIVGDYHFSCPAVEMADRFVEDTVRLYQYVFTHRSSVEVWPLWMGVIHTEELAYVFAKPLNATLQYKDGEKVLSDRVMRYWTNFAKTGNPNHPEDRASDLPNWPQRTDPSGKNLVLNVKETVGSAYRARYCKFWESIREDWAAPSC